jgi:predicted cobalt transporter CbtA
VHPLVQRGGGGGVGCPFPGVAPSWPGVCGVGLGSRAEAGFEAAGGAGGLAAGLDSAGFASWVAAGLASGRGLAADLAAGFDSAGLASRVAAGFVSVRDLAADRVLLPLVRVAFEVPDGRVAAVLLVDPRLDADVDPAAFAATTPEPLNSAGFAVAATAGRP